MHVEELLPVEEVVSTLEAGRQRLSDADLVGASRSALMSARDALSGSRSAGGSSPRKSTTLSSTAGRTTRSKSSISAGSCAFITIFSGPDASGQLDRLGKPSRAETRCAHRRTGMRMAPEFQRLLLRGGFAVEHVGFVSALLDREAARFVGEANSITADLT